MQLKREWFNQCARAFTLGAFAAAATTTAAYAQNAAGQWGAEGRIGGGQGAYVSRWFSPNVSLVFGGGVNQTTNSNPTNDFTNKSTTGGLLALIRKEWGTGRVHPFVGVGPIVNISRTENGSTGPNGVRTEARLDTRMYGGRFEFGGFVRVVEFVDLGVVGSVTGQMGNETSKVVGGSSETKRDVTQLGAGNPQFIIRIRF